MASEGIRGLAQRYPTRRKRRIPEKIIDLIRHARVDFSYGSTRLSAGPQGPI